ncbi:transposase [Sphaerimonospora sp. CA-214678]|uniref:transposase n=1 Tax=Sphaerimonospora sp. CA-214678 TaxID=3240029 RepID=UPI003D8A0A3A
MSGLVRDFAAFLEPKDGNDRLLTAWIRLARQVDLPHVHTFTRGLVNDRDAVDAALCLPFHNGGTEGVYTKTKLLKRQMYGRAGFALLCHRILLG